MDPALLPEAARLLAGSDVPIAEVAIASGFRDQSHLTRAFRARFGMPPAAFRRARRSAGGVHDANRLLSAGR